jgi:outer membrane protein assembly factor BamA
MTFFVCLFGLMTAWVQNPASNVIEKIEFRGVSHVSEDSVRAAIHTRAGDVYDEEAIHRDFKALWDTGRFNDVQVKKETSERGGIMVRFIVTERAASIEGIEFSGLSRVPEDAVRAIIHARTGDVYDEEAIRRDFKALWDTGRFNDVQVKKEIGARGGVIVRFVVTERR